MYGESINKRSDYITLMNKKQKICVLGAGIVGITTAWLLRKQGFEVFILESENTVGRGTSFANGAQISVSNTMPWSSPQAPLLLLGNLFGQKRGIIFSPRLSPEQWLWGAKFLYNCRSAITAKNLNNMLDLCLLSRRNYIDLINRFPSELNYCKRGILHFYTNKKEYEKTRKVYKSWAKSLGEHCQEVTTEHLLSIEPNLTHMKKQIVGGFYAPDDMVVDTHRLCQTLIRLCEYEGVDIYYNSSASKLNPTDKKVVIETSNGEFFADHVVCCTGIKSNQLLSTAGIRLAIYPVKGYSITIKIDHQDKEIPNISMIDQSRKIVMSRLGDRLRVAGIAEINGYNTDIIEGRIEILKSWLKNMVPKANLENIDKWAGLRPMTPSNIPYVGRSQHHRIWLNCGHGSLGLTMAMGSAERVVRDILNNPA